MSKSVLLPLGHLHDGKFGEIPEKENEAILHLADPMVQSFNYAMGRGIQSAVSSIPAIEVEQLNGERISITLLSVAIEKPHVTHNTGDVLDMRVFPRQCIESGTSYKGSMSATIGWKIGGGVEKIIKTNLGLIPIMVKSNKCNLHGMKPAELISYGEDVNNPGGYFIINGSKKVLRLLTAQRRNYAIALTRDTWRQRQKDFTDKGVILSCAAEDETTTTNILHYLTTGFAKLQFFYNKKPFLIDLVILLKAFKDINDRELITVFSSMRDKDTFFIEKLKQMLTSLAEIGLYTSAKCREYIGNNFRQVLKEVCPSWKTDTEVCEYLLEKCIFIHLQDNEQKFHYLCFMACKLYAYIAGDTVTESMDVLSMMETHLSGFLYLKFIKEKLQDMLISLKWLTLAKMKEKAIDYQLPEEDMRKMCGQTRRVGHDLESLCSTGSISSKTGIGMSQMSGLSVVLEGLNRMRDLSHLRAIHRGSYFLEMKTVLPRRLTGEAWGFICPVHTPDGAPCGLLNHLSYACVIPAVTPSPHPSVDINVALVGLGMVRMSTEHVLAGAKLHLQYPVLLDGSLTGYIGRKDAQSIALHLRIMKTKHTIYQYTEIVLVEQRPSGGQFPGLYLFTSPARMMRPVVNLHTGTMEFVGTFEQMYLNVAISTDMIQKDVHSHVDMDKTQIFSNIGKLVPFSDCNPNPRNMYQCQMGKQTMGTPLHNWRAQTYNKAYRLLYPQVPLVRNAHYDKISMEDHCMGFNAVLAIISYTGYDIEDAMTINKAAMERGLAHGQLYKTEYVNLSEMTRGHVTNNVVNRIFSRDPNDENIAKFLDLMGLPIPGTKLDKEDPYYCTMDVRSGIYDVHEYKGEPCVVDKVSLVETATKDREAQKICITIRAQRNPAVGDKFASRSGQKGIMSRLYPTEDLPFSERGIMPDIIFNPHGIPSRMTAGKLIELIAGKAAAEYALSFDSTPFQFSDEKPAAEYFGSILEKAGFNYYGEDVMYSGIDGRMMKTHVYQGIMYYQRLKHMTEDKYQVRSTGAVDVVTRQPVKGRKRGGAIRFGEMERDALIAHGAVFTLKDRLLDCSDASMEWVCSQCGGVQCAKPIQRRGSKLPYSVPACALCGPDARMVQIEIPHAFKYLVAELASLSVSTRLKVSDTLGQQPPPIIKQEPRETIAYANGINIKSPVDSSP